MEYKVTFTANAEFNVCVEAENICQAKTLATREVEKNVSFEHTLKDFVPTFKKEIKFTQPLLLSNVKAICCGIMNTSNCHDSVLVETINILWDRKKEAFKHILTSLMARDIVEMYEHNCFGDITETDLDIPAFRKQVEKNWENCAESYLMRVADDSDLQFLISFVEMTALS